jgi:hypothetical protein
MESSLSETQQKTDAITPSGKTDGQLYFAGHPSIRAIFNHNRAAQFAEPCNSIRNDAHRSTVSMNNRLDEAGNTVSGNSARWFGKSKTKTICSVFFHCALIDSEYGGD